MNLNTLIDISRAIGKAEKTVEKFLEPTLSALSPWLPFQKVEEKNRCAPPESAPTSPQGLVEATTDVLVELNGGKRDQILRTASDGSPVIQSSLNAKKYYVVRLLNQEPEIQVLFKNNENSLFAKALSLDPEGEGCKVVLNDRMMEPSHPLYQLMRGGYQYFVKHETVHCDKNHPGETAAFTIKTMPEPPPGAILEKDFERFGTALAILSNQAGPEEEVRTFMKREAPKLPDTYISDFLQFRRASLALSREQEYEADVITILDMALHGYNPEISLCVWQQTLSFLEKIPTTEIKGKGILEIKGTEEDFGSPTPQRRAQLFKDLLPLARVLYGIKKLLG